MRWLHVTSSVLIVTFSLMRASKVFDTLIFVMPTKSKNWQGTF